MSDETHDPGTQLAAADELLMTGRFDAANEVYEALLAATGEAVGGRAFESLIFRAALLVRGAVCQFVVGATQEADEMLGYLDRQLSIAVRQERDRERFAALAEAQENVRFYRVSLEEASRGGELEFPVTLCQHDRQVPLLPCGFIDGHD